MSGEPVAWLVRDKAGLPRGWFLSAHPAEAMVELVGGTVVPLVEQPAPVDEEAARVVRDLTEGIRGERDGTTIPVPVEDARLLLDALRAAGASR